MCDAPRHSLITLDHHHDAARVRIVTMFEEKEPLPGAESHAAIHDRDDFAGAREDHADV